MIGDCRKSVLISYPADAAFSVLVRAEGIELSTHCSGGSTLSRVPTYLDT
jgi:hypothetical protein